MKKVCFFIALVFVSAQAFAASITASDVDFGEVSIKGLDLVSGSGVLSASWDLPDYSTVEVEILNQPDENCGFSIDETYVYTGGGYDARVNSYDFTISYSADKAGSYSCNVHFYVWGGVNWDEIIAEKTITVSLEVTAEAEVELVANFTRLNATSELKHGDAVIFVNEASGAVCGPLDGAALSAISEGVKIKEDGTAVVPEGVQIFIVQKYNDGWQFFNEEDETKRLHLDVKSNGNKGAFTYDATKAGEILATWAIEITDGVAEVTRNDDERTYPVRYNSPGRFKPYLNWTGDDIALYRKNGEYVEVESKLTINPETIVFEDTEMGQEASVEIAYTAEYLEDNITWSISGADAALFEVADEGDRESGIITIKYLGTGTKTGAVSANLTYTTKNAKLDPMSGEFAISLNLLANTIKLTKIELVNAPTTIDRGTSIDLSEFVVLTPSDAEDKTILWEVAPDYQATIDQNGVVTAKYVTGNFVVTVSSVQVPEVSATHTMNIVIPSATGITLSASELTLNIGNTETLTATVLPAAAEQSVTFSSADKEVAKVSNKGVITAVGLGDVVISVSQGEITETCLVHVVRRTIESFVFDPSSVTVNENMSLQLTPVITPAEAASEYVISYTSDNEDIATVSDEGVVTGQFAGKTVITATVGELTATVDVNVVETPMFEKVQNLNVLANLDTIILAAIVDGEPIIAGGFYDAGLAVLRENVVISNDEAYAEEAGRLVLDKVTDGFMLRPADGEMVLAEKNNGLSLERTTSTKHLVWQFVEDGTNGIYVQNADNHDAMFKYLSNRIRPYKSTSAGAVFMYVYYRPYVVPGTAIDEVQKSEIESRKVFRNGQILILREGVLYDVHGVKVE